MNKVFILIAFLSLLHAPPLAAWQFGDPLPSGLFLPYGEAACSRTDRPCDPQSHSDDRLTDFDMFDGLWRWQRHSYPYASAPNGCSSLGAMVENFGPADFRPACNIHDACYYRPNREESISMESCNGKFLLDLRKACSNAFDIRIKTCTEWKFVIKINYQKAECIGYSEIYIPSTLPFGQFMDAVSGSLPIDPVLIPGLGDIKEACELVATAMAAAVEASPGVFNDARTKQANYEAWVTGKVQHFEDGINSSISNIIHPTYMKYYNRQATDEEIAEGLDLLMRQQYPMEHFQYDMFVSEKFNNFVNIVFQKTWGMCDDCFQLYVREPVDYEIKFVEDAIRSGKGLLETQSMYKDFIRLKFMSYFTSFFGRPVDDNFVENHGVFGKLLVSTPEGVMGLIVNQYANEVNSLVGMDLKSQPGTIIESETKDLAALGYYAYLGKKLTPAMIPIITSILN